jgi:hypothetical protein
MDNGKIYRIIRGNDLKPENFTSIDENGIIYVTENGVDYRLDGFKKSIIVKVDTNFSEEKAKETLSELMSDYKNDVKWDEDIKITADDKWEPIADITKGLVRSDEEIKRIKAIKKPRGWHFKDKFVDSEGNVYVKGVLQ